MPMTSQGPRTGGAYWRSVLSFSQIYAAWQKVRDNRGVGGVDGVSIRQYENGVAEKLEQLRKSVMQGSYQPAPLRRVWIPKPGKQPRGLAIPTIADRVLQTSIAQVLTPIFEAEFED